MKVIVVLAGALLLFSIFLPAAQAYGCVYGNYYDPYGWTIFDRPPGGNDTYALLIKPGEDACLNGNGFQVLSIWMTMSIGAGTYYDIQGHILEAVDDGNGCFFPGMIIGSSDIDHVTGWPEGGVSTVGATGEFDCLPADRPYFLMMEFVGGNTDLQIVSIDDPATCSSYVNQGAGYVDLQNLDGGGLIIRALTDNCEASVPSDQMSWDSIKAAYK